jgi:hypothetical protein
MKFAGSLKESQLVFSLRVTRYSPSTPPVHLKYWMRTVWPVVFRMQNRKIQGNFADHRKLFIF